MQVSKCEPSAMYVCVPKTDLAVGIRLTCTLTAYPVFWNVHRNFLKALDCKSTNYISGSLL